MQSGKDVLVQETYIYQISGLRFNVYCLRQAKSEKIIKQTFKWYTPITRGRALTFTQRVRKISNKTLSGLCRLHEAEH